MSQIQKSTDLIQRTHGSGSASSKISYPDPHERNVSRVITYSLQLSGGEEDGEWGVECGGDWGHAEAGVPGGHSVPGVAWGHGEAGGGVSDPDPCPDPRIGSAFKVRIRIGIQEDKNDPQK